MTNRINKTSICSILFLDIIDYSKKSDADQIEIKNLFNDLISHSLESVAKDDRIILDTGDGLAIAYMGSPEDLMFVALSLRDGILKGNILRQKPLFIRSGINLGPVRIVNDINGQPNIIGDGVNVAQRIMSFSEPNQILVSRSYYEVTSRLTEEFSEMFAFSGVKQDKHVREHEIYSVRSHIDQVANIGLPEAPIDERKSSRLSEVNNTFNWKYAIPILLIIAALVALVKLSSTPSRHINTLDKPILATPEKVLDSLSLPLKPTKDGLMPYETVEILPFEISKSATKTEKKLQEESLISRHDALMQEKALHKKLVQEEFVKKETKKEAEKTVSQEAEQQAKSGMPRQHLPSHPDNPKSLIIETKQVDRTVKIANPTTENEQTNDKSLLKTFTDSVHQGQKGKCSQVEITMNQCK